MLPPWEERPLTIAHLLNPAFCGEIIKRCILEFQKINTVGLPYQLVFLVLPIVLNKTTRNSLPKSSSKNFVAWIEENQTIKKDLPEIIKNILPYSQEAIMFLMMYNIVSINSNGHFETKTKNKTLSGDDEVSECYKKSELLGKMFAKAGTSQFIFINLGIKP